MRGFEILQRRSDNRTYHREALQQASWRAWQATQSASDDYPSQSASCARALPRLPKRLSRFIWEASSKVTMARLTKVCGSEALGQGDLVRGHDMHAQANSSVISRSTCWTARYQALLARREGGAIWNMFRSYFQSAFFCRTAARNQECGERSHNSLFLSQSPTTYPTAEKLWLRKWGSSTPCMRRRGATGKPNAKLTAHTGKAGLA